MFSDESQIVDSEQYTRPIWQIALKTFVTHGFALVACSQYNNLLHTPSKHNSRLFRLLTFAILPTTLLGQLAFDLVRAVIRALQNPDEIVKGFKLYFDGILGARAIDNNASDHHNDDVETENSRSEATRLLDIVDIDDAHKMKSPWTWKRLARVLMALIFIAQAVAVIVLFVRRSLHEALSEHKERCGDSGWRHCEDPDEEIKWYWHSSSLLGMDFRNLYIACAGIIASVLTIYGLIAGVDGWRYEPAITGLDGEWDVATGGGKMWAIGTLGELKRVLLDFIIGAVIQELIAVETYYGNESDGAPLYVTCLLYTLDDIDLSVLEWILIVALIGILALFRHDIASRLGIKLRVIYTILVAVFAGWLALDTVALLVTDLGHFIIGNYGDESNWGERWMDPVEKWVPII